MSKEPEERIVTRNFFVDEAGDGTLFDKKGHTIIGTEGCSWFFILGALDVTEPERLSQEMNTLRAHLLADPYFKGVASMQPQARKTALAFHAKDDLSEVRREVFHLLAQHDLRFYAVVRAKDKVLNDVKRNNSKDASYRYNPNDLYDTSAARLFLGLLHKYDAYNIYFARRGKSDRTAALRAALENSQRVVNSQRGVDVASPLTIFAASPKERTELQATDYFLWALQRFYERGEDRYISMLWPSFRFVCFISRKGRVYFTQKRPLIGLSAAS